MPHPPNPARAFLDATDPEEKWDAFLRFFDGTRILFWLCSDHPRGIVTWVDEVATCQECGRKSSDVPAAVLPRVGSEETEP